MTQTSMNLRPDRAVARSIRGALVAAALLVALVGAAGAEVQAKGSKGEEIPSLAGRMAPRNGQVVGPALNLPVR